MNAPAHAGNTAHGLFWLSAPQAKVEVHEFASPEQEETYDKLIAELRCLVCQNQNLADSNAELAVDLRRKTYEMVSENKSEKEIATTWSTGTATSCCIGHR